MHPKVIVTGSDRGSYTAYLIVKFFLNMHNIDTKFFHPSSWNKNIKFDGLLLTGGVDIDPSLYSKLRHKSIKKIEPKRDKMELYLLEKAYKNNLPVFGICRGMQMINVFFGGDLYQNIFDLDLKYKHPKTILPLNQITIKHKTKLYSILKVSKAKVNALHHQAINKLGKNIIASAHDKNRIIQAIEHKEKNILAVQWHPEFMPYSYISKKLFKNFSDNIKS